MKNIIKKPLSLLIVFMLVLSSVFISTFTASAAAGNSLNESFDDITTLAAKGWFIKNNSSPRGTLSWFQGYSIRSGGPFNANTGENNAYIAVNFNSAKSNGTISNWLITPELNLSNGSTFTFYTRKPTISVGGIDYPDRLEVRMSTNGASTDVGTTDASTGDFTTLMISINPTLVTGVYPQTWTQYTATVSGLSAPTTGRIAFRYFVTNAGPTAPNSDYIGIDDVVYTYVENYEVALPTQTGYTITPKESSNLVSPGGSYSFTLALNDGYTQSKPVVKVNGNTLTAVGGVYTITNINEAKNVTVEGVALNTYGVTLTSGTGYSLKPQSGSTSTVTHGGSYSFTLALNDGYTQSTPTVKVNGSTLTAVSGVYTISNITQAKTVTVEGVDLNSYGVTLTSGTGYKLTAENGSTSTVSHGGSYSFTLALDDGYTQSTPIVKVNGSTLTAVSGVYTISNITEAKVVTVEGVALNTYVVILTPDTGYTLTPENGSTSPVTHGSNYSFTLNIENSYDISKTVVKVNGTVKTAIDGVYIIENIISDLNIEVSLTALDKKVADETIKQAKKLIDSAIIGSKPGEYSIYAVDKLLSAIKLANEVVSNPGVTQTEMDQAAIDLKVAIDTFKASVIKDSTNKDSANKDNDKNNENAVESPKTGDTSMQVIWLFIIVLASGTLCVILQRKRKTV